MDRAAHEAAQRVTDAIRDVRTDQGLEATIDDIVRRTLEVLPGCDAVSLAVVANHTRAIDAYSASRPELESLDRLQFRLGEGPAIDATAQMQVVESSDLARESRWDRWRSAAVADEGFQAVRALPIHVAGRPYGTLLSYGTAHPLPGGDQIVTHLWAAHVASAVAAAHARAGLEVAVDSRTTIGVAIGMLMVQYGIDRDRAFDVLKRTSQSANRKLTAVVEAYIETRRLPGIEREPLPRL
ncbi:GAF and ANTAR domain-containing protein [Aeromicrobium sp. Sec7.5]|uniref:GAF and ANTAR domain-containing protein n=1 Tax=Aeromicrobium sp. Sec7.5 TaxID=3121276 RepID=UPI002FE48E45